MAYVELTSYSDVIEMLSRNCYKQNAVAHVHRSLVFQESKTSHIITQMDCNLLVSDKHFDTYFHFIRFH